MTDHRNDMARGNPVVRFILTALLVAGIIVPAFSVGTFVGGTFLVPPGQGLAGPAEAMGYGLLAALLAAALAILAGFKLHMRPLAWTTAVTCVLATLLVGGIAYAIVTSEDYQNLRAEYANPGRPTAPAIDLPTTAPTVEPNCPLPEGDDTTYGHPPCQDE